jgi:hypothetical protein
MAKPQAPTSKGKIQKIAVDSETEDYWETYFGPYGAMFTREIPRKIASGLVTAMQRRQASKGAPTPPMKVVSVKLAPKAKACKKASDGSIEEIRAEGVFRGVFHDGKGEQTVRRFFHAVFDGKGQMTALESVAVG